MTDEEASNQAKARWGPRAIATRSTLSPTTPEISIFRVGKVIQGKKGEYAAILGYGANWEEAFTNATTYERYRDKLFAPTKSRLP